MLIEKIQKDKTKFRLNELYYPRARDAMYDFVQNMCKKGYHRILLPGYIGWSLNEGSGIFDPINEISGLSRTYYKMSKNLEIDKKDLLSKADNKSIILIVNYFGFRDHNINNIIKELRKHDVVILEDNAHGYYTYHLNGKVDSDATFFSLHKMFPISEGGSLITHTDLVSGLTLKGSRNVYSQIKSYDIYAIGEIRRHNFKKLLNLVEDNDCYYPLKIDIDLNSNIPQTFPIVILKGNRDLIYEEMNKAGYGVVSLYHTMIEDLDQTEYADSFWLSKRILNLPIHQDVNTDFYEEMIEYLIKLCRETDVH